MIRADSNAGATENLRTAYFKRVCNIALLIGDRKHKRSFLQLLIVRIVRLQIIISDTKRMVADMCEHCQQVIEQLGIDIELFFRRLADLGRGRLTHCHKEIICQSLLGYSRKYIDLQLCLSAQTVRDRMSRCIYSQIAELMQVDQEAIAGNWVLILNLLLNPRDGYKLNPAPQLNSDNFQGS